MSNESQIENQALEERILAALVYSPDLFIYFPVETTGDVFHFSSNREIFLAIKELHFEGLFPEINALVERLTRNQKLQAAGGEDRLGELLSKGPSSVGGLKQSIASLVDSYDRRKILDLLEAASLSIVNLKRSKASVMSSLVESLTVHSCDLREGLTRMDDCLAQTVDNILAKRERPPTIPFGYRDLDALTGGMASGELILIAARPSVGKSTLMQGIALNALQFGPSLIYSMEMSAELLANRLLAFEGKIDSRNLRSGELTADEWESIEEVRERYAEKDLWIDSRSNLHVSEIMGSINTWRAQNKKTPAVVLIDYAQLFKGCGDGPGQLEGLSTVSARLKQAAKEFKIPIVLLSQLNRGVESRADKKPLMSDLRGGGSLEQNADLILLLSKDEETKVLTVDVAKFRDGPKGSVELLFDRGRIIDSGFVSNQAQRREVF